MVYNKNMNKLKNIDKVMIVGDCHGQWHELNNLIEKEKPEIILACGDFGIWPAFMKYALSKINVASTKIYFCDGNHEDHDFLENFLNEWNGGDHSKPHEIHKNIFYCPRGSTLDLPDGRVVLFMGGAYSIDKARRTPGFDWFPQETLKPQDMEHLPDKKIDILISHTCAKSNLSEMLGVNSLKGIDISNEVLERVVEQYSPKLWFFGHWHYFKAGWMNLTKWTALAGAGQNGFWIWLNDEGRKW